MLSYSPLLATACSDAFNAAVSFVLLLVTAKPYFSLVGIVSVTANEDVYLNKERVDKQNLPIRISEVLRNRGSKVVFFSVEDSVNYGHAVQVMDVVRNNGAKNIGIVMDWVNPVSGTATPAQ